MVIFVRLENKKNHYFLILCVLCLLTNCASIDQHSVVTDKTLPGKPPSLFLLTTTAENTDRFGMAILVAQADQYCYLATSNHILHQTAPIKLYHPDSKLSLSATQVARDPKIDIALLRFEKQPHLKCMPPEFQKGWLPIATPIIAFGNPVKTQLTASQGIVKTLGRLMVADMISVPGFSEGTHEILDFPNLPIYCQVIA